jgi:hypothetical protein
MRSGHPAFLKKWLPDVRKATLQHTIADEGSVDFL